LIRAVLLLHCFSDSREKQLHEDDGVHDVQQCSHDQQILNISQQQPHVIFT
jgi:hypothetical protein